MRTCCRKISLFRAVAHLELRRADTALITVFIGCQTFCFKIDYETFAAFKLETLDQVSNVNNRWTWKFHIFSDLYYVKILTSMQNIFIYFLHFYVV